MELVRLHSDIRGGVQGGLVIQLPMNTKNTSASQMRTLKVAGGGGGGGR
jgi:hypothetical protein